MNAQPMNSPSLNARTGIAPTIASLFPDRLPVWLCPVVSRRRWPTYPFEPGTTYVNVGFWGTVHVGPEAVDAPLNRAIEAEVMRLGGHKSLYSEAFYDPETFATLYGTAALDAARATYDPDERFTTLYEKAVRRR